ncbi:MAG: VOC family protein [Rhodospirillales bacterium]|jgi:catechol 2,3-dioxygenase-like lactoylglutathione lyase family enzyme|nr:VOC family protein [Rhodospirillales bacterium]
MAATKTKAKPKAKKIKPLLKTNFLSHGTVETHDMARARRFYEEVLGFQVAQTSKISMMMRRGKGTIIACVQTKRKTQAGIFSHFGLDVDDRAAVDKAHKLVSGVRKEYGIKKITRPLDQHGTYAFYMVDADDNWWEILTNPKGGYNYVFDLKENSADWRDQNHGRTRIARGKRQTAKKGKKKAA